MYKRNKDKILDYGIFILLHKSNNLEIIFLIRENVKEICICNAFCSSSDKVKQKTPPPYANIITKRFLFLERRIANILCNEYYKKNDSVCR
jgi:hypothetical protein